MPEPAACAGESRVQVHGAAVDDGSTLHDACPRTAHVRVGVLRCRHGGDGEAMWRRVRSAGHRLQRRDNGCEVRHNPMVEQLVCCPCGAPGLSHGSPSRYYSTAQQDGHVTPRQNPFGRDGLRHPITSKRAGSSHMILSRSHIDGAVLPASVLISVGTNQEADPTDHRQKDGAWLTQDAPLAASTVGTWTMALARSQAKRWFLADSGFPTTPTRRQGSAHPNPCMHQPATTSVALCPE
jgi:hypothetical protein